MLAKIGILALALSLPLVAGCSLLPKEEIDEPPQLKAPPQTRTVVYKVERGYVAKEIRGLGRAASTLEKSLYFRIAGRLKKVYVDYGSEVKAGDPLMELETGDLKYNLRMAKLDLEQAQLRYKKAKLTSGLDGGTHKFDFKSIQIDYEKAKARVDDLVAKLEASTLRAPFTGRVVEVKAKEGDYIQDYSSMVTVADPNKVQVEVEVDSEQLSEVLPDMKAKVSITQDTWVEGTVRQVATPGSELSPGVPDRRVMIKLNPADEGQLIYNDPYQVIIITQEADNALIVPNAAIRDYMGRKFVRVIKGDSRREADVEVGIEGVTETQILKGVKEGEKVQGR
jgi:macrolide-specific efflux system membrane fusion protein